MAEGATPSVDPEAEENVNSLGGPAALMPSPTKDVQDAPGSAEHMLAVGRPPSSSMKSHGKATEAYNQEHDEAASSTKIIPKANADAGPSVRAPAHRHDGVIAVIGGPVQPNASDVASNAAPVIPAFAQHDVNVAIVAIGGAAAGAGPAAGQPNVARQVPAPARINGGGIAVIAAHPALAQPNAGGPAAGAGPAAGQPNVARQVPAPARINGEGIAVIAARPALAQPNAGGPAASAGPVAGQPNVARQVPAPARINGGGIAVIAARPALAQPNAGGPAAGADPVAGQPNVARQVPAPARINGGGIAVIAARPALAQPNAGGPAAGAGPVAGQPNVARQVPAPARINGGGIAVIAARPALAQPNARGPALNAALPVPVLPPNPGVNYIDEALKISIIQPLRNPADGDEGKIWNN